MFLLAFLFDPVLTNIAIITSAIASVATAWIVHESKVKRTKIEEEAKTKRHLSDNALKKIPLLKGNKMFQDELECKKEIISEITKGKNVNGLKISHTSFGLEIYNDDDEKKKDSDNNGTKVRKIE